MPQTRGDVWAAIEANRQYTAQVELNMTRELGEIKSSLAGISGSMMTEQKFEQLLAAQKDREEHTYRRFEDDRIAQLRGYPAEQRDQRNLGYMADQSHSFRQQAQMALYTPFISAILSLLVSLLVVKLL